MSNRYSKIEYSSKLRLAKNSGGDYYWDISSINYNQVAGTLTPLYTGCKLRAEPCNDKLSSDKFRDAEMWLITADRTLISPGIFLQETTSNAFPPLTVIQSPEMQDYLAFNSSKTGQITDNGVMVYSNIAFNYSINLVPARDTFQTPASLTNPFKKVVVFSRAGILPGMIFQDLTFGQGSMDRWKITIVDYREEICVLNLEAPNQD